MSDKNPYKILKDKVSEGLLEYNSIGNADFDLIQAALDLAEELYNCKILYAVSGIQTGRVITFDSIDQRNESYDSDCLEKATVFIHPEVEPR